MACLARFFAMLNDTYRMGLGSGLQGAAPVIVNSHLSYSEGQQRESNDPTGYLQEKQLSLKLLQKLIGLRITKDRWYGDCLEYPLINTQNQLYGYERIYARGLLHKRCPDRFNEKDNKKVTRDTRTSKCFAR